MCIENLKLCVYTLRTQVCRLSRLELFSLLSLGYSIIRLCRLISNIWKDSLSLSLSLYLYLSLLLVVKRKVERKVKKTVGPIQESIFQSQKNEKKNLPAVLYGREILHSRIKVRSSQMLGSCDIVWNERKKETGKGSRLYNLEVLNLQAA